MFGDDVVPQQQETRQLDSASLLIVRILGDEDIDCGDLSRDAPGVISLDGGNHVRPFRTIVTTLNLRKTCVCTTTTW